MLHTLLSIFRKPKNTLDGYYFLRNYKATHRSRVELAIKLADLSRYIVVQDSIVPNKIAVFCCDGHLDAESLFFQYYAQVKAAEHRQ